ncbi:MAG: anti-sigma factor [Betaproteobacteria bacterium]|nr:anti-sigma factor [Betaproteobacteria bacterium]
MKLAHPELRNSLASEYVLGTMKGAARRRFEEYLRRDIELQREVQRWENHLTPLTNRLPSIDPPDRVWSRIEARLDGTTAKAGTSKPAGLWESLAFWRNLGLGASGLAAALLIAVMVAKPVAVPESGPMLTAVLAEDNNLVRIMVEQPKAGMLNVTMVKPWRTDSGFAHELWVIPKEGAPRSVGVINDATDTKITLAGLDAKLVDGALFAVSLEPPGGSPSGLPTGKVVCKGSIAWMPKKPRTPAQI